MLARMPASEPARHALYSELQRVLGADHADTLMTYLPRHRSDEVATKADIAVLEGRFDRLEDRFDRFEDRFDRLEERFVGLHTLVLEQQRFFVGVSLGTMTGLTAVFAVVVSIIT